MRKKKGITSKETLPSIFDDNHSGYHISERINNKRNIKDHIKVIEKLYNEERFDEAYKLIKRIESENEVELNIDYFEIKYLLCIVTNRVNEFLHELEQKLKRVSSRRDKYFIKIFLAALYFRKGLYLKAQRYLQDCLSYFTKRSEKRIIARIYYLLGYMAFQRNNYEIADAYYDRSLEYYSQDGTHKNIAQIFLLKAILSYKIGRYSDSISKLLKASRIFKRYNQKRFKIQVRLTFGRALLIKGDLYRAEKFLVWSVEETRKFGYKRFEALANEFLGELRYYRGDYKSALKHLSRARGIAHDLAPRGDIAVEVLRRLGEVLIAMGELKKAQQVLEQALDISENLEDRYERGAILRNLGILLSKNGNTDLARAYFNESIVTLRLIKDRLELAKVYEASSCEFIKWMDEGLIRGKAAQRLLEKAKENIFEALRLYSLLGMRENLKNCKELLKLVEKRYPKRNNGKVMDVVGGEDICIYNGNIVAHSSHMKEVVAKASVIAKSDISVLITGETGTGKELIARYIHDQSGRKGKFVAVNCAAIPEAMFESEFFGHRKGAFTDARFDKVGLIEDAQGGTLFLDEFTELSDREQAKLLRVLQEGKLRRVGEVREREVNVRVISACNGDIESLLSAGKIRRDFFYRACGEKIEIKPLRFRREDIRALVIYYINKFDKNLRIEADAIRAMEEYHWPGNVRELINLVRVLIEIVSEDKVIRKSDLPSRIRDFKESEPTASPIIGNGRINKFYGLNADAIKELLETAVERNNGNYSAVARELGVSRSTIYRWMRKTGLKD